MISQNEKQDTQINVRYTEIAPLNEKHGVILVRDESSGRMYVKKILKTYNLEVYERLRNAKIKGLPEIFHMEENDGELTVIEQYISGETVDSILKNRGAIPEDQVRDIAVKLCDILTDLHSMDPPVIHRDIKPSNVMVTPMGEVMLLDLNAAKLEDTEKAEDTVLLGTYGYAAPEQFGFGSSTVQTDIYAVGMLMNTMLLGEYSKDIVQGSILSGIIEKCVMIRAEDRYKSAAELRSALKSPKKKRISAVPPGFRSGNPLHKVFGNISVELAEPGAASAIRKGDEVTVVAISRGKILGTLIMYSGYLDGMQKTANSVVDGQVIVIDDYVSFAQKYDSYDSGKTVQITAKVQSVTERGFSIDEGFPDDMTSGISVELASGEPVDSIKEGDTVTFVGRTDSKMFNLLFIKDAHIGAAKGENVVNYTQTESYAEKNKPKTYTQCTVSQMVSDMDNNPMSAKDRYLDKDLQITGIITKIDSKGKNFYIGVSSSSGVSDSVYCSVETEDQRQKLMNLSKGNSVTVRGNCYSARELLGYSIRLDDILTGY